MDKIDKFLARNPKYKGLRKPLKAAEVCGTARKVSESRFGVVSFNDGLLTLAVSSPSQAASVQMESQTIIAEINLELKEEAVKKIRYKIQ